MNTQPHSSEPSLEKLRELKEGITDAKKSDALNKQIARREQHERNKLESIPNSGSSGGRSNPTS